MKKRSLGHAIFLRTIGFLAFLVLLGLANYLAPSIDSTVYRGIVSFLISNILLILLLSIFGVLSEVLWTVNFPMVLIAPWVSSLLSIFIITFIYRFWLFLEEYITTGLNIPIDPIYSIVFWIVLIGGYISIILRFRRYDKEGIRNKEEKSRKPGKTGKEEVEWEDVGEEFKNALFRIGKKFNSLFGSKNKV